MVSDIRRNIEKAIAEDGTVLFVGAGISTWSGIPGWGRLLNDMADYVDRTGGDSTGIRKYKDSQPLLAADLAKGELTREQYHGFLKSEMRVRTSKPGEIHQLLLNLGINCFITTNFDRLLERAIRANGKRSRLKVVTNTDVQQCADLCAIKSRNFVFKPHGDIMDGDSIIFTNSDYRDMYENGGRYYAHRTLDTLLATRNIIFVGFGLTDPDFLRIMDRFRNDYKQGITEKYAIMPDVPTEEINYWKAAYGIQILSYDTIPAEDGRDYSNIFKLLRELAPSRKKSSFIAGDGRGTPDVITQRQRKGLAVYAQSLMARFKTNEESIFPLELCPVSYMGQGQSISTEEMLKREVRGFALTGNPGSGKTFFMKRYCAAQAKRLLDWCNTSKRKDMPFIPVYIDLKNYCGPGSIEREIEDQFPDTVQIHQWMESDKVLYLLDSYNEIESRYMEDGCCRSELEHYIFFKEAVVASRTGTGGRTYKSYRLEAVEGTYVKDYLVRNGLGRLAEYPAIMGMFQSPLYFQLLQNKRISVDESCTVKDIYLSYFRYIMDNIREKLGISMDIIAALDDFAFELFCRGAETFTLDSVSECMRQAVPGLTEKKNREMLNFLMDRCQFLVPLPENRAMFFHQSVTEFLAAGSLASCGAWRQLAADYLEDLRWNQVFLFAAGFFEGEAALEYITVLLGTDSVLAAQAAEYVQDGCDDCSMLILEHLYQNADTKSLDYYISLEEAHVRLPVTGRHEGILRMLVGKGDLLGGIAAGWLLDLMGNTIKEEMIGLIFAHCKDDFNFVTRAAGALSSYITVGDYKEIIRRLQDYEDDPVDGLSGFDELSAAFSLGQIAEIFQDEGMLNHVQRQVMAQRLQKEGSQEAFELCLRYYLAGWDEMLFTLYLFIRFEDYLPGPSCEGLIDRLMREIECGKDKWAIGLLYSLYHKSDAAAKYIRGRLKYTSGIVRLAFYYVIGKNRTNSFFSSFISMLYWEELPDGMVDAFDEADWTESVGSVIRVLYEQNRIHALTRFLDSLEWNKGTFSLDAETLCILLTVIKSCEEPDTRYYVGKFMGAQGDRGTLMKMYYLPDGNIKTWMRFYVLPYVGYLEREDFTDDEIQLMLRDLHEYDLEKDIVYTDELLLVNIADDTFIRDVLEPMLAEDEEIVRRNMAVVLDRAGEVHSKRYVSR